MVLKALIMHKCLEGSHSALHTKCAMAKAFIQNNSTKEVFDSYLLNKELHFQDKHYLLCFI